MHSKFYFLLFHIKKQQMKPEDITPEDINLRTSLRIKEMVADFIDSLPKKESEERNDQSSHFYQAIIAASSHHFCSSAAYGKLNMDLTYRDPEASEVVITRQDRDYINTLALDAGIVNSIRETLTEKRGVSVIYVQLKLEDTSCHVCLLVFDGRTKMQHYFDPLGFTTEWLVKLMSRRRPFVEGFRVASVEEDSWHGEDSCMQVVLDETGDPNETGNCGVYAFIVTMLCLRHGIGNPKKMATIYTQVCIDRGRAGRSTRRLWSFLKALFPLAQNLRNSSRQNRASRKAVLSELIWDRFRTDRCGMYCPSSGKLCERTPCGQDIFCWQHRFEFRNKDAEGPDRRRCSAKQVECKRVKGNGRYLRYP